MAATVRTRARGGERAGGGLPGAVAAEWTKLWSVRSTWWGLAGSAALMGLMSLVLASSTVSNNTNEIASDDQGVVPVSGVAVASLDLVQFVVVAVAILVITGEYATGSIRSTLQWVPRRGRMLASKAVVLAAVMLPAGAVLGAVGTAVAGPVLGGWGRFRAVVAVDDALQMGVYLALVSLLVLGIGAMLRSTAGTLTTAFLFLLVVPMLLVNAGSAMGRHVADALPSTAGRYLMNGDGPYPAGAGAAILAAWTVAALWGGVLVLRRRDA
ncbi:ABC transporter permease [Actinomadura montaniterrae]|uniref:ABC transporter permease n=1 Tax=Actinomadura montaniterrae TaxID=1803903 RepID=A0A6L3VQG6_9ACTN|nr:ABC transporter permease [Actinomadura montaniterrae]KAB2371730.1 ABC transporter permease [Actinomadura montaniterrae]